MAFDKLNFSKNWENAEDFPTFEQDEAQVRKDLQLLHDETKAYLNDTLLPQMDQELDGKANDDNILHKDETEAFTPTLDTHPATKKYVDEVAAQMAAGSLPDKSVTPIKMANSFWDVVYQKDAVYNKDETYSKDEANALLDKKASQSALEMTNVSVAAVNAKFGNLLLRPVNPVELGPYDVGDEHWVCDGNGDAYKIYTYLTGHTGVPYDYNEVDWDNYTSNSTAHTATVQKGRYSYGYWNRFYAYKLDHVTKQATMLCDLSSYKTNTTSSFYDDGIFSVDDQYVYLAIHSSVSAGTIYKFDHTGNVISSVTGSNWGYAPAGAENTYSIFNVNFIRSINQTKNFIVIRHQRTGYTPNYWNYHVISKNTLKHTVSWQTSAYYACTGYMYNSDIVFCPTSYYNYLARKLTDSGYEYLFKTTYTDEYGNTTVSESQSGNPCYVKYGSTTYNLQFSNRLLDLETGICYYGVYFTEYEYGTRFYAIVSEDDLDVSTGKITLQNYYTSSVALGINYYDPVLHDFTSGGKPYEVYPAYVAPENPVTLNDKFTMAPYFKTDDYYYFVRTVDNQVFKCKNEDQYVIDRVLPFPEVT